MCQTQQTAQDLLSRLIFGKEVLPVKPDIRKLLSFVLLAVFLVSTTMFVLSFFDKQKGETSYQTAESLAGLSVDTPTTAPTEATTEPTAPTEAAIAQWVPAPVTEDDPYLHVLQYTNLDALRQVNPQVTGWIRIPGTSIHYPITQTEDNSYYLTHTWEGEPNYCGAIFLETMNSADFSDFNTIIYGHNMRNGSMFAGLHDYTTLSHWAEHPYVYLVTDEGVLRYEIFSSYNAAVDSKTYGLSFRQSQTREEFIAMALENSDIDTGLVPATTDRILTLSTCTGLGYRERRVVHAYLPMELSQ